MAIRTIGLQSNNISKLPTVFSPLMNLKNNIHRPNLLFKSFDVPFFVNGPLPLRTPSCVPVQVVKTLNVLALSLHLQMMKENCSTAGDWLDLRDGNTQNSSLLRRFCGSNILERSIQTTSNNLLIHMHTDSSDNNRGFILKYKGIKLCIDVDGVQFLFCMLEAKF